MKKLIIGATVALLASMQGNAQPVSGNCGMQLGGTAIFCDTFDNKNPGIPSRTGDLDPNVWGVSRATGNNNFGQGLYNGWAATTQIQTCNGTTITVTPPNDIMICNGQLRESNNDNPGGSFEGGTITVLAMYPKQPFDFAGRTGTVSFDVSNDTHGSHAAWPEFWMSNLPVPAPFNHFDTWETLPQHGFGIGFDASVAAGSQGACPNGNNLDKRRWTVGKVVIIRNYVMSDMPAQLLDCVTAPPDDSGITNHVEFRISQNQIDVYATDAGVIASPLTLKHIAVIANANLSFTRGLIWLEDAHYNADKGDLPSQKQHTFVWDNVAFDGPFTYRDFSYDALDGNQLNAATSTVNLGKLSFPNQTASWNVLSVPANPQAAAVRVLFNFMTQSTPAPTVLNVTVNGHAHPTPWPYPDTIERGWRTFAVTIPITDLVPGTNVVQLGSDQAMVTSNVNIVLVDVPGGVPVLPGSNNAYPVITPPPPPPLPTVVLSANPSSILTGGNSTLTWSSTNATSCVASGGWAGTKPVSGSLLVLPTTSTSYTLTCSGAGGTALANTTVAVSALPLKTCTITIAPFTVPQGQATTFSVQGTASCQ